MSINLSNFDTSLVTNMGSMFYNCKALTKLDIRNFTFDKVTSGAFCQKTTYHQAKNPKPGTVAAEMLKM